MAAHQVRKHVGSVVARRSGERTPRREFACTFDVWGPTIVGDVDVAAVFVAATVRMGDWAWLGSVPASEGQLRRVRLSRVPVHGPSDDVDAVFILEKRCSKLVDMGRSACAGAPLFVDATCVGSGAEAWLRMPEQPSAASRPAALDSAAVMTTGTPAIHYLPLTALAARLPSVVHGERLVLLGMWSWMFGRDPDVVRQVLEASLARHGGRAVSAALRLFELGWHEAPQWLPARSVVATTPSADVDSPSSRVGNVASRQLTAMNGVRALVAGARAAGLSQCRLLSEHPLVDAICSAFVEMGGVVVTPGGRPSTPGIPPAAPSGAGPRVISTADLVVAVGDDARESLHEKHPHVVFRLERLADTLASPATNDLSVFGQHSSRRPSHPVVLAPTTVAECYQFAALAGAIAAQYRRHVVVLVDAALLDTMEGVATGPVAVMEAAASLYGPEGVVWPPAAVPGAAVTDLLQQLQLAEAPLEAFVRRAPVVGGDEGEVLIVGWGATRGPVEEAVALLRAHGRRVSALHLRTLRPLPIDLVATMARFRRVVFVDVVNDARLPAHLVGPTTCLTGRDRHAARTEAETSRISCRTVTVSSSVSPGHVCELALKVLQDAE